MIATELKEIDGVNFEVRGLDLRTERAVFVRLTKLFGPALVEFMKQDRAPAPAIGKLLEVIDNTDLDYLCTTFAAVTRVRVETNAARATKDTVEGGSFVPVTDAMFVNGIGTQMKWLWFCLEHQYAAFLGGDGTTFLQALQDKAKASA